MLAPEMKRPACGPGEAGTDDGTLHGHDSGARVGQQGHAGLVGCWRLVGAASRRPDLSRGDIAVLWAILDRIGADGTAWPGYSRIATDAGLCRSTVTRSIRKLVVGGILQRDSGGPGKPNRYRPGRCSDAPRCEGEPRCSDAPRRRYEPRVGAPTRLGVGAPTLPEPASLNLLHEPAKATVHSAAPTALHADDPEKIDSQGGAGNTPTPGAPADELPVDPALPKRIRGEKPAQTAARFPEFWAAYPVKKGRAKALAKWKAKGLDAHADKLIAHVRRMEAEDDQWGRGFIPHGDTYINDERWTDEPMKDKQVTAQAPPPESFGAKAALAKSESKLENALAWIRQQRSIGAYGEGEAADAEMRKAMAEATEKHRNTAASSGEARRPAPT